MVEIAKENLYSISVELFCFTRFACIYYIRRRALPFKRSLYYQCGFTSHAGRESSSWSGRRVTAYAHALSAATKKPPIFVLSLSFSFSLKGLVERLRCNKRHHSPANYFFIAFCIFF